MKLLVRLRTNNDKRITMNTFIVFVIYKLILDFVCCEVYQIYSPSLSSSIEVEKSIFSWALYIIVLLFIVRHISGFNNMLSFMYLMSFALNGVGFYSIYAIKNAMTFWSLLSVTVFWFLFAVFISIMSRLNDEIKFVEARPKIHTIEIVMFSVAGVLTLLMSGLYGDFRLFISFGDVYEYRSAFLEQRVPALSLYIIRLLSAAILPYFYVRFIISRKNLLAVVAFILGLFMYGIDGLKTTLMMYILIFLFFIVYRWTQHKSTAIVRVVIIFVLAASITMMIGYFIYKITGNLSFNTELYRVFIIPASISDNYYSFVHDNQPLLWRESIMRFLFASPYPKRLSYMLSVSNANANSGLYGDAYANFKEFGIIIYSFLYSLVFYKWNQQLKGKNAFLGIALGFIMVWNSINLPFFTWLLTGGVILIFVMTKLLYTGSIEDNVGK